MNRHQAISLTGGPIVSLRFATPALAEDVPAPGQDVIARLSRQIYRQRHDAQRGR